MDTHDAWTLLRTLNDGSTSVAARPAQVGCAQCDLWAAEAAVSEASR